MCPLIEQHRPRIRAPRRWSARPLSPLLVAAAGIDPVRKLLRLVDREPAVNLADAAKDRLHDREDRNRAAIEHDGERVVGLARREVSEIARGRSSETGADGWLILLRVMRVGARFGDLAAAHNRDSAQKL